MTLADFTAQALIVPALQQSDSLGAIEELTTLLTAADRLVDGANFKRAVLARERLGGTNMGGGIALPHGRSASVPNLSFAMGRIALPLPWNGAASGVRLVFLLAIPEHDSKAYLSLISGLARFARQAELTSALLNAKSAVDMLQVLAGAELRPDTPATPRPRRA